MHEPGQCYDSTSVCERCLIRFSFKDARIRNSSYFEHSINLAANDALKSFELLKDALNMTQLMTHELIKYTPIKKRSSLKKEKYSNSEV